MSKHSRFLSLVLRHKPEEAGLTLDPNGWVPINGVLKALSSKFGSFSRSDLETLVRDNDKQRFAIENNKIRANQGHSIDVDLQLEQRTPPAILYHGTKSSVLNLIMTQGLIKGSRDHVHLSADIETARIVAGRRNGQSVILEVATENMEQPFYCSANGVWLTSTVSPDFLTPIDYI